MPVLALLAACVDYNTTITVALDGDATGQTLLLLHEGDVRMERIIDFDRVTLELPRPDADLGYGTVDWYAYVRRDDGVYTGASVYFLYWEDYDSEEDRANFGYLPGWNVVSPMYAEPPQAIEGTTLEVSMGLTPSASATLGGTWAGTPNDRLQLVPFPGDGYVDAPVADLAATDPWTITASGDPPTTQLDTRRGSGERLVDIQIAGAFELPVAYDDNDASGTRNAGDRDRAWACLDGSPVVLAWVPPATDPSVAQDLQDVGTGSGWNAIRLQSGHLDGRVPAGEEGSTVLDDCYLGG